MSTRALLVAFAMSFYLAFTWGTIAEARKLVTLKDWSAAATITTPSAAIIATPAGVPEAWAGTAGAAQRPFTFAGTTIGGVTRGVFTHSSVFGLMRGDAVARVTTAVDGTRTWTGSWTIRSFPRVLRGWRGHGTVVATLKPLDTTVNLKRPGWLGV